MMIAHGQLFVALAAGILAGFVFLLAGRWLMRRERADNGELAQEPMLQPRPVQTQDNLSPEALAFIKALRSPEQAPPKPSIDPKWAVDIWDDRQSPDGARGLPH